MPSEKRYYVYSVLSPVCNCCNVCYDWEDFPTLPEATKHEEDLKEQDKRWESEIIYGYKK